MLIDELEELLPYVNSEALTWRDVLDARFTENGVGPDPLHSTLISVRVKKNVATKNDLLSEEGARIGKLILERYHFDKMPAG